MARIIGLKEKQRALAEMTKKINSLVPINSFLTAENPSGLYTISFGDKDSKEKATLLCNDPEAIRALVFNYKKELVAEIRQLAADYTLELEDEDEEIIK